MSDHQVRDLNLLAKEALSALADGGNPLFPLIDGRILSVQATPEQGTSSDMALGVAVMPAGYSTPQHSHRAEEIAIILRGTGVISIDGEPVDVTEGSVVLTPPHLPHVTTASADGPLVIFWVYAPAGSETRWLAK
jgi:mannose-6-phosphate isomerase-like protein (cupin superfamily)